MGAAVPHPAERSVKLWMENELVGEEIKMPVKLAESRQEDEI